jgi:large subunit ribosomal protein L34
VSATARTRGKFQQKFIRVLKGMLYILILYFLADLGYLIYSDTTMSFTYNPKKRKRARSHGFLIRKKTTAGRNVVKRRRQKGRAKLTV